MSMPEIQPIASPSTSNYNVGCKHANEAEERQEQHREGERECEVGEGGIGEGEDGTNGDNKDRAKGAMIDLFIKTFNRLECANQQLFSQVEQFLLFQTIPPISRNSACHRCHF